MERGIRRIGLSRGRRGHDSRTDRTTAGREGGRVGRLGRRSGRRRHSERLGRRRREDRAPERRPGARLPEDARGRPRRATLSSSSTIAPSEASSSISPRRRAARSPTTLIDGADVFLTNIRLSALERVGLGPSLPPGSQPGTRVRHHQRVRPDWSRSGPAGLRHRGVLGSIRCGRLPHASGCRPSLSTRWHGRPLRRDDGSGHGLRRTRRPRAHGLGDLVSASLLRQGAYTIGFDVNVALMWGTPIRLGSRSTMTNPTVNNYTAGDGRRFWIVGLEGERHWPPLARAVGHPEWLTDERFDSTGGPYSERNRAGTPPRRDLLHPAAIGMGGDL